MIVSETAGRGREPTRDGLYANKTTALSLFRRAFSPCVRQVTTGNTVRHRREETNKMIITAKKASALTIANQLANIVINK